MRLPLALSLVVSGCFTEFPAGVVGDGGRPIEVIADVGQPADTGRITPDVAQPELDGAPPDGPPDARLRRDQDPNRCAALDVPERAVHIRTWDQPDVVAQQIIPVRGMDCPGAVASPQVDWLEIDVRAAREEVVIRAKRAVLASGRHQGSVALRLGEQTVVVDVTVDLYRRPPEDASRHVLVIGAAGLRGEALEAVETPALDWLVAGGAFTAEALTQQGVNAPAPGWASFFTGVSADRHKVESDDFRGFDRRFPSFVTRAAPVVRGRGGRVAFAYNLAPLFEVLHHPRDVDLPRSGEGSLAALAADIEAEPVHLAFAHIFQVAEAGPPDGAAYTAAVQALDDSVDMLLGAILSRPGIAQEDWRIVLSADSGAGDDDVGTRIPLLVAGPSMAPGELVSGSHLDVHPTVLAFLGVPFDPDGVEGRPIGSVPVPLALACEAESVASQLGQRVAEGSTAGERDWLVASCDDNEGPERVWHFTAPDAGLYVFNTVGSGYDTMLSLRAGDCEGEELACDDDTVSLEVVRENDALVGRFSLIRQRLAAQETVAAVVGGFQRHAGDAVLNIHPFVCQGAVVNYQVPNRPGVGTIQTFEADNTGAPTLFGSACAPAAHEVVFSFRAPRSAIWRFDTLGSEIDTVLSRWDGACAAPLDCEDDGRYGGEVRAEAALELELRPGTDHRFVVSGKEGAQGRIVLRVQLARPL